MKRACSLWLLALPLLASAGDWTGQVGLEGRLFLQEPLDPVQQDGNLSLSGELEYYHKWDEGSSLTFKPFARIDQHDDERTHWDIRELQWTHVGDDFITRFGIGKEFWGVTEAVHLVDIINQTDLVENPDGEQKLGQPMLKVTWRQGMGSLDLFMLPWFRERTFPGEEGRMRTHPRVDSNDPIYESSDGQHHVDWAARWSSSVGAFDLGLSWFRGTGRDPLYTSGLNHSGEFVLFPYYEQIEQGGLDVQATLGGWLLKAEAIYRDELHGGYYAWTSGFEYTLTGLMQTDNDLGLLVEAMYDQREDDASLPFNHDLFFGARWTANDEQSTELLGGIIYDWKTDSKLWNLEASRRIGQNYKLSIQSRGWFEIAATDLLRPLAFDDYLQVELTRYF